MSITNELSTVESLTIVFAQGDRLPAPSFSFKTTDPLWQEALDESIISLLDLAFRAQGNNLNGSKLHSEFYSLSIGDIIVVNESRTFFCSMSVGWMELNQDQIDTWNNATARDRSWLFSDESVTV